MKINWLKTSVAVAALAAMSLTFAAQANAQDSKKFKVYLSLSYSGNAWQSEAANIVKALAATPPYNDTVELIENISAFLSHLRSVKPAAAKGTYIRSITISATMSPGIRVVA